VFRLSMTACFLALAATHAFAGSSPYRGHEHDPIKALSPQQTQDYLDGKGIGYAKAAELNHYPGPIHVLELADELRLTAEQREAAMRLMKAHRAEAQAIGRQRVDSERTLEMLFRSASIDQAKLDQAVRHAAALEGEYRLAHLETHRRMRSMLTAEQVALYDRLRGYAW
jgi:Spy/CpxP family protein refolding chaperone